MEHIEKTKLLQHLQNNKIPNNLTLEEFYNSNYIKKAEYNFSAYNKNDNMFNYILGHGDPRLRQSNFLLLKRNIKKLNKSLYNVKYEFIPSFMKVGGNAELPPETMWIIKSKLLNGDTFGSVLNKRGGLYIDMNYVRNLKEN